MALWYVHSAAAGSASGADWANAKLTIAAAHTASAAGDTIYVAHDHAETQASALTLTAKSTYAGVVTRVICVDRGGTVPPVSADLRTTATVTTTGANAINFVSNGVGYYRGIIFSAGTGAVTSGIVISSAEGGAIFVNCALRKLGTTANIAAIWVGGSAAEANFYNLWENTTVQFGATGDGIVSRSGVVWRNTASAITGATFPTVLFRMSLTGGSSTTLLEGVDLSALGSGNTLVSATYYSPHKFIFKDCKLGASVTVAGATAILGSQRTTVIRADSGATNYRTEQHDFHGDLTTETTIVRTGGATDGTTPIAWKIITSANTTWLTPLEAIPITIWNDTVGSAITVTLYGIWGGGAVPISTNIWMDAEYMGSTATPQASFATSGVADILAAGANLTSDDSAWGGSTTKFKMSVTFTPQMKGPIKLTVKAALASSTFYIDPEPEISGVTVAKSYILGPDAYVNELSSGGAAGGMIVHPGMNGRISA